MLGNTELGELLKFQQLLRHYYQHNKSNADISFISFISLHYLDGDDGTDTDNAEEEKLPCHNWKQEHSFSHTFTPSQKSADIDPYFTAISSEFGCCTKQGYSPGHVLLIFQPPRV